MTMRQAALGLGITRVREAKKKCAAFSLDSDRYRKILRVLAPGCRAALLKFPQLLRVRFKKSCAKLASIPTVAGLK